MAGRGNRFIQSGYDLPKPLISINVFNNKPMIQVVVENLNIEGDYIFIVQKEHYEKYNLGELLISIKPGCKIIQTNGITEGAACTTLLAEEFINNSRPLIIANSDQFIEYDAKEFEDFMNISFNDSNKKSGIILIFNATDTKWSYVELNMDGCVIRVAEKDPISDNATVGIYVWKEGLEYVKYAKEMINKNIRVNNEFYVAPVYSQAIEDNKEIWTFKVDKMWGIGTPEDLNFFLNHYKLNN